MSDLHKLRKQRERMAEAAGEGSWYRNTDNQEFIVDVTFYPDLQLWITIDGKRHKITRDELKRDYHRLKL